MNIDGNLSTLCVQLQLKNTLTRNYFRYSGIVTLKYCDSFDILYSDFFSLQVLLPKNLWYNCQETQYIG